jgi:hypothetical protein
MPGLNWRRGGSNLFNWGNTAVFPVSYSVVARSDETKERGGEEMVETGAGEL